MLNAADRCPAIAEDKDGVGDDDGCPEDDDADGVADAVDRCRSEPEDRNGFEDGDGCPDEPRRLERERSAGEARQRYERAEAARLARLPKAPIGEGDHLLTVYSKRPGISETVKFGADGPSCETPCSVQVTACSKDLGVSGPDGDASFSTCDLEGQSSVVQLEHGDGARFAAGAVTMTVGVLGALGGLGWLIANLAGRSEGDDIGGVLGPPLLLQAGGIAVEVVGYAIMESGRPTLEPVDKPAVQVGVSPVPGGAVAGLSLSF